MPCKGIQGRESWILDPITWIPDSGFRIPDSLSYILDSKAQDSGLTPINAQNFPGFRNLHVKIFSHSGIRIPLHGRIQGRGPGGGGGGPPLFPLSVDETFFETAPPYLKVWMTPLPPYLKVWIRLWAPMVYSHFSVSLVCQKQGVHPGLVDVQALLGQKTTSQPTREFKTANRQWHFNLKYRYPNHRNSRFC